MNKKSIDVAFKDFRNRFKEYFALCAKGNEVKVTETRRDKSVVRVKLTQYKKPTLDHIPPASALPFPRALLIRVDDLSLIPDTHNNLKRAGLDYMGDVIQYGQSRCRAYFSYERQMDALIQEIDRHGLQFGMKIEGFRPENQNFLLPIEIDRFLPASCINRGAFLQEMVQTGPSKAVAINSDERTMAIATLDI